MDFKNSFSFDNAIYITTDSETKCSLNISFQANLIIKISLKLSNLRITFQDNLNVEVFIILMNEANLFIEVIYFY